MEHPKEVIILGAGGLGREMARMCQRLAIEIIGFVDDNPALKEVGGFPILGNAEWLAAQTEKYPLVLGHGSPAIRAKWFLLFTSKGWIFPALIDPGAHLHHPQSIQIGSGSIIADGSILTTDIEIGHGVLVNLACTIGHDTKIAPFAAVMPGVHLSGNTTIGSEAMVGTGAVLLPGVSVGARTQIGAGSVVTQDIPAGETWAGVPAKRIKA